MADAVHKTGNRVLIDKYAQKTALRLGVTPDAVRAEFEKMPARKAAAEAAEPSAQSAPASASPQPNTHEYWLVKLLLLHDDLIPWAAAHLDISWVRHPLVAQIVSLRLAAHTNQTWTNLTAFLDECESPELKSMITEAATQERLMPQPAQQLADVALRLRNQCIDQQLAAATQRAGQTDTPESERTELLRRQQQLRLAKRAPLDAVAITQSLASSHPSPQPSP
jgi:hypothetical protein